MIPPLQVDADAAAMTIRNFRQIMRLLYGTAVAVGVLIGFLFGFLMWWFL